MPRDVQAMRAYKNAGPASGPQGPLRTMPRRHSEGLLAQSVISDRMLRIWLSKGKRGAHVSVEALFLRGSNTLTDGLTVTTLLFHALSRTFDVSTADMSAVTQQPVSRMLRTTWPSLHRMCCSTEGSWRRAHRSNMAVSFPLPSGEHRNSTLRTLLKCWIEPRTSCLLEQGACACSSFLFLLCGASHS